MNVKTEAFNEVARQEVTNEYAKAFLGLLPPSLPCVARR